MRQAGGATPGHCAELAGGGWYETDFKKDGKRNLAGDAAKPADAKPSEAAKPADTPTPAPKPDAT